MKLNASLVKNWEKRKNNSDIYIEIERGGGVSGMVIFRDDFL